MSGAPLPVPYSRCGPEERIRRDEDAYVRGEIDVDELERRVGSSLRLTHRELALVSRRR